MDGYILCATPRSGTTLLCGLLKQTGVAGAPDSFYRTQSRAAWAARFGIEDPGQVLTDDFHRAFLDGAIRTGRGSSGVFGMRLMQENLSDLVTAVGRLYPEGASDADALRLAFGDIGFVYLCRRDPVAQAISLVRAQQSGLWHRAADGSELERLRAHQDPVYTFAEIDAAVRAFEESNRDWNTWFSAQHVTPLRLFYEDLAEDPQAVLAEVLTFLGQDPILARAVSPAVSKLADDVSERWAQRYKRERG